MQKERMTVHKALAELKLLEGKVEKAIREGVYCIANQHSNDKLGGIPIDKFINTVMKAKYDEATDYIKRQEALKKAVSLSNAVTKVSIAGIEYTVAEAIWMKNHGVESKLFFVDRMRKEYEDAQAKISRENENLNEKAENYIIGLYSNKESRINFEEIEKTKNIYIKNHQYELIDPLNIIEKINRMEKEINDFLAEVDSELSVSNALTEIEIEY